MVLALPKLLILTSALEETPVGDFFYRLAFYRFEKRFSPAKTNGLQLTANSLSKEVN